MDPELTWIYGDDRFDSTRVIDRILTRKWREGDILAEGTIKPLFYWVVLTFVIPFLPVTASHSIQFRLSIYSAKPYAA